MDSRTEGLDSLAQAPLLPYTFWEGPGLVRPRGQGCRKGAPSEEGARPGWEEGPPGQSLKGVVSVFEHENGVIDLQGWAQLDTHDLHNVRLCQQKEGLAVNHLRGAGEGGGNRRRRKGWAGGKGGYGEGRRGMWQAEKDGGGGAKRKDKGGKKEKRKTAMGMEKESKTAWLRCPTQSFSFC